MKGKMFVISGPSGVGKGTIVAKLMEESPELHLSISATTRGKRAGEEEGINYYYKTREEFENMKENGALLEWAEFCGNFYGTPRKAVEEKLAEGKDVILEIETEGAMKVKKSFPESVSIFVVPPSMDELISRLRGRGTETEDVIARRIEKAKKELGLVNEYDYVIINDTIPEAVKSTQMIIASDRFRTQRAINDLEVLK